MWPLLRDVPWQRALLVVLIGALFYLHYRWAVPAVPPACLVVGGLCAGPACAGSLALLVAVQQVPSTLNGRHADIAPAPVLSVLHAATARWTQPLNCLHAMLIVALIHACRTFKLDPGYLEARGLPQLMTPAQRMMMAAQVCKKGCPLGAAQTRCVDQER